MKKKFPSKLNESRIKSGSLSSKDSDNFNGLFILKFECAYLRVIISDQMGWDHVSVSTANRTPTWKEMCHVRDLFFDDEEVVVQYHPAKDSYVNVHPYVLHLWKSQEHEFPAPPTIMV